MNVTPLTVEPASLTSEGAGVIVVSRSLRILFRNRRAEAMLATSGALVEEHLRLGSRLAAVESRLRAAVRTADALHVPPETPQVLHLPRVGGSPHLGLIVPLRARVAEDLGALLMFWAPESGPTLPISLLRQLFGLTPGEALVALATCQGQTPAEIAAHRQRSVATVRTLLSRAFSKCGVKRQVDLVRLLAGIANACSFVEGLRTGLDLQRLAQHQARQALVGQLMQSHDLQTTVRIKDFAPGESTPPHYHTHGHEVVCVLRGATSTGLGAGAGRRTEVGQALYVGENVLHQGRNASLHESAQVLVINMAQRGRPFRVEAPPR